MRIPGFLSSTADRAPADARSHGVQVRRLAFVLASFGAVQGCGGASTGSPGAKAVDTAPAPETPSATAAAEPGTTTTTTALPDAGAAPATRLPDAPTGAAPASKAASGADAGVTPAHAPEPGRGPADIRAIVMAHRDEARACYDRASADHPGIEGDLVIRWTIDPKGNVSEASVDTAKSQILEPSAGACVADVIKKIKFAPSPGGYETRAFYPFNFRKHGHAPAPQP